MPSLAELAKELGVSRTTVSLVLNGRGGTVGIAHATQERVRAHAQAVGYRPNYHARTFNSGRSDTIGLCSVVLSDDPQQVVSDFWSRVQAGIVARANTYGSHVLTIAGRADRSAIECGVQFLREKRVDALMVPGHLLWRPELLSPGDAAVVIMPWVRQDLPWVGLDAAPGLDQALQHLAEFGHVRLLYIAVPDHIGVARERARLVARLAHRRELTCRTRTLATPVTLADGPIDEAVRLVADAMEPVLAHLEGSTALVCYNDIVALGALHAAARAGLRVPHDISIVGFDDVAAAYSVPRLATVSHALFEIGAAAADLALGLLRPASKRQRRRAPPERLVPSYFVPGSTTSPAQTNSSR